MKNLFIIAFLSALSISIQAQTVYYPQVFFDKKLAQEMIGYGNSTITGVASTREKQNIPFTLGLGKMKTGKKHVAKQGTVVMLIPVTPYFEEFYKMRKKYENSKTSVYMSEEAFKYRIDTTTDEFGRFKFEKLKPGKYYIETILGFTATASYQKQTGRSDAYNAYGGYLYSTPIYSTFFYDYAASNRESKFVEIKQDGQVLEIDL